MVYKILPTIGIYTPIHKLNFEHLDFLVKSLNAQTFSNYFWTIILNGELLNEYDKIVNNLKSRYSDINIVFGFDERVGTIGSFKDTAVRKAILEGADILLELDYDDALNERAIEELTNCYLLNHKSEKHLFFYSNFAHFDHNNVTHSATYSSYYGWKTRLHSTTLFDIPLNEMIAFPPENIYFARIESAPNHLRAFTKELYEETGGYNTNLKVGDDHELMIRMKMLSSSKFIKINECLYYQRYDGTSTTFTHNNLIQTIVQKTQNKYQSALLQDGMIYSKLYSTESELLESLVEFKENSDLVDSGKIYKFDVVKGVSVLKAIDELAKLGFQYHSWTEINNIYALYFTPLKGWYKENYWGDISLINNHLKY